MHLSIIFFIFSIASRRGGDTGTCPAVPPAHVAPRVRLLSYATIYPYVA